MSAHSPASAVGLLAISLLSRHGRAGQTTYPNVKVTGSAAGASSTISAMRTTPPPGGTADSTSAGPVSRREGQINEYVTVNIQPSFEGGQPPGQSAAISCTSVPAARDSVATSSGPRSGIRLRDAWIDVRLNKPETKTALRPLRTGEAALQPLRADLLDNLASIERGAGAGLPASQPLRHASGAPGCWHTTSAQAARGSSTG